MSLANFERFFDRIAPAILLVLGLTVAAATAVVGV
jgi:NADH:ubiquinone oxidoreductase subunit K